MRTLFVALRFTLVWAMLAAPAAADRYASSKKFGLGLMIGAPTGLTGKYFLSRTNAFDFGIGGIGYYRHRDGLHLHADYLWHPLALARTPDFKLPLYFGVGARVFSFNDGRFDDDGFAIGVRAPLGIAFDFNKAPLDVFIELALVMDFFTGYVDDFDIDVNGAVGIRYWF